MEFKLDPRTGLCADDVSEPRIEYRQEPSLRLSLRFPYTTDARSFSLSLELNYLGTPFSAETKCPPTLPRGDPSLQS